MSDTESDRGRNVEERDDEYSDIDADDVVDDAAELLQKPDPSPPVADSDADAPAPPG